MAVLNRSGMWRSDSGRARTGGKPESGWESVAGALEEVMYCSDSAHVLKAEPAELSDQRMPGSSLFQ